MNRLAPWIDWIDSRRDVLVRRVIDWSTINSGTGNIAGIARLSDEIRPAFAALGGAIEEIAVGPAESIDATGAVVHMPLGNALRIVRRSNAPLKVFLGIHLDTVYPPNHPFQTVELIDSNTLRGPGVADAKGGLVVMLAALEALERSPFAEMIGWEVLLNPDEEIGSVGSAPLLAEAASRNHLGLVFEPALGGGALADRRRGVGNFAFVVRGRAAHAGRDFHHGRNAIAAAAELAVRLHALNETLTGVTINVGRLIGGGAVNVVPDLAVCWVNVRTTEPDDETRVRIALGEALSAMRAHDGILAEQHGTFTSPPKSPDDSTRVLMRHIDECRAAQKLEINWRPSGGACDGNKLAAAGLPNVDSLGPRGGDIHSPAEHIFLDSLAERAKLTALLLLRLASGDITWPPR